LKLGRQWNHISRLYRLKYTQPRRKKILNDLKLSFLSLYINNLQDEILNLREAIRGNLNRRLDCKHMKEMLFYGKFIVLKGIIMMWIKNMNPRWRMSNQSLSSSLQTLKHENSKLEETYEAEKAALKEKLEKCLVKGQSITNHTIIRSNFVLEIKLVQYKSIYFKLNSKSLLTNF